MEPDRVVGSHEAPGTAAVTRQGRSRRRRFRRAPYARCVGTTRRSHSAWDCVAAGWPARPCRAPGGVPRRHRGTRRRCRSGPPDDDREGIEDAPEGRPHVAPRRGGDELGGSRFRDRVADRQLIDPATGEIAPEQGVGLHPLSGWVETTALLSAVAWRRAVDRSGWICWRKTLVFLEIFEDPPDRHPDRTAHFPPAFSLFLRLSPACRQCHMCLIVCSKLRPMAGRWPRLHRGR